MTTIFNYSGRKVDGEKHADAFVIDGAGVSVFEDGEAAARSVVYRRGFAWRERSQPRQPQFIDGDGIDRMVFVGEQPSDVVYVFIDGKRVGGGKKVRLDIDRDRTHPFIRVGGRTVAVFEDGEWYHVNRNGERQDSGPVTIGPRDLHDDSWLRSFTPSARSRPSALAAERVLNPA